MAEHPMTANDLIEELETLVDQYGDCPINFMNDAPLIEVRPYDEKGEMRGPIVEFALIDGDRPNQPC
jgi:hypothetical protein